MPHPEPANGQSRQASRRSGRTPGTPNDRQARQVSQSRPVDKPLDNVVDSPRRTCAQACAQPVDSKEVPAPRADHAGTTLMLRLWRKICSTACLPCRGPWAGELGEICRFGRYRTIRYTSHAPPYGVPRLAIRLGSRRSPVDRRAGRQPARGARTVTAGCRTTNRRTQPGAEAGRFVGRAPVQPTPASDHRTDAADHARPISPSGRGTAFWPRRSGGEIQRHRVRPSAPEPDGRRARTHGCDGGAAPPTTSSAARPWTRSSATSRAIARCSGSPPAWYALLAVDLPRLGGDRRRRKAQVRAVSRSSRACPGSRPPSRSPWRWPRCCGGRSSVGGP